MARFSIRRAAFVLIPALALSAAGVAGTSTAQASLLPSSCQQIKQIDPIALSGTYTLKANGNLFTVYCKMSGTPASYIDLAKTGTDVNYSQYTAGGAAPGTNVRTTFTKVRVDPATLTVDIGDLTFASSTGTLAHPVYPTYITVTSVPYASAMACNQDGVAGTGNVDLEGTPFQLAGMFAPGGYEASGSATVSADNQVANLAAYGYCGFVDPVSTPHEPYNPAQGQYVLKLSCSQTTPVIGARLQFCLHVG